MCGIVGIVGNNEAAPLLIDSLKRLEYRGYDSAGIATIFEGKINRSRSQGKLINLENKLKLKTICGTLGIGHTRWATHGGATENNAHPHMTDKVAVVHNGIIENYKELKLELQKKGYVFESETDTEVIAHLVTDNLNKGQTPDDAVKSSVKRLKGAYSIAIIFNNEDNLMIGVRCGTPLAIGYGKGEMYLASDTYALAPLTNKISFLEDGDYIRISRSGAVIFDANDNQVLREIRLTAQSRDIMGKGKFPHFMLKEIYEQPSVIEDTLNTYINPATGRVTFPKELMALANVPQLTISACGTAYYAGIVAKYWFEKFARIPVEADIASEFRYRESPMPKGGAALFVSQSGETLDTLEALRYAKSQGQKIISVLNTIESTMERESDHIIRTLAGPEIGVASTKAFTTQLTTLACLAIALGRENGTLSADQEAELITSLREAPKIVSQMLKCNKKIEKIAKEIAQAKDVIYIGRGTSFPVALEGALKLKEVSYIHAEGHASGELKHGPIAMIDEKVPVVVVAPDDNLFEKTASNAQEIIARGGKVMLISSKKGLKKMKGSTTWNIEVPEANSFINPIIYAIPVQLLAYHAAIAKGNDVDKPRNLAKSVTVE